MPAHRIVRCLSFHAAYSCQDSGVCCGSRWEIQVEPKLERRLRSVLQASSARLPNGPDGFLPPAPSRCGVSQATLRLATDSGACWFRDQTARRCSIHREFGQEALPSACRHFPRICVLEPHVVSVSLSHYCPTAVGLLFGPPADFAVIQEPTAFPTTWLFEGLDASAAYPPFLRPGVLLGFDGLRSFENASVALLNEGNVEDGLSRFGAAVETLRGWTPSSGSLLNQIPRAFEAARAGLVAHPARVDPREMLRRALPSGIPGDPVLPEARIELPARPLSGIPDLAMRRYLASRLIAAWIMFQGDDLRTVARYLRLCFETAILFASVRSSAEPEEVRWREAIRNADLWIIHYCDPDLLAENLR